mmetsp:Transcript_49291/g.107288  ORF Transcript_49291/g.107288 Transcript_49291/m.107288 type:complete len:258 (+) Transcript_49291:598-1371(+)
MAASRKRAESSTLLSSRWPPAMSSCTFRAQGSSRFSRLAESGVSTGIWRPKGIRVLEACGELVEPLLNPLVNEGASRKLVGIESGPSVWSNACRHRSKGRTPSTNLESESFRGYSRRIEASEALASTLSRMSRTTGPISWKRMSCKVTLAQTMHSTTLKLKDLSSPLAFLMSTRSSSRKSSKVTFSLESLKKTTRVGSMIALRKSPRTRTPRGMSRMRKSVLLKSRRKRTTLFRGSPLSSLLGQSCRVKSMSRGASQ